MRKLKKLSRHSQTNFLKRKIKNLFFLCLSIMLMNPSYAQTTVPLYKEVPNSKPATNYKEKVGHGDDGIIRISKVSIPEIAIFQPTPLKEKIQQ